MPPSASIGVEDTVYRPKIRAPMTQALAATPPNIDTVPPRDSISSPAILLHRQNMSTLYNKSDETNQPTNPTRTQLLISKDKLFHSIRTVFISTAARDEPHKKAEPVHTSSPTRHRFCHAQKNNVTSKPFPSSFVPPHPPTHPPPSQPVARPAKVIDKMQHTCLLSAPSNTSQHYPTHHKEP